MHCNTFFFIMCSVHFIHCICLQIQNSVASRHLMSPLLRHHVSVPYSNTLHINSFIIFFFISLLSEFFKTSLAKVIWEEGRSPNRTTCLIPGPVRPMMPNGIWIRSAVLPQCTGQTDWRAHVRTYVRRDRQIVHGKVWRTSTIGRCATRATWPNNCFFLLKGSLALAVLAWFSLLHVMWNY